MTLRAAPAPLQLDVSLVEHLLDTEAVVAARAEVEARRTETCALPSLAVVEQPRRALEDYCTNRRASEVSRMLAAAARLRELVDRVVIVGSAGTLAAVRALLSSCLHPYHNELSRGARGGRPRVYFVGDSIDNDALHGLLEILESTDAQRNVPADAWAILALSGDQAPECVTVLQLLHARLATSCDGDEQRAAERICVVAGVGSPPADLGGECLARFTEADELSDPWSIFTAAALLPAAVVGIDIVRLLVGGVAASEAFADGDACPARELAAHRRALANGGAARRTLTTDLHALRGFRAWHDDWLAPMIHGGGAPGIAGTVQRLVVTAARTRCDALGLASAATADASPVRELSIGLELPALDEASLGQLAQTLLLATLLERLPPR
ncbi:MAG: hypothetical protein U0836_05835 [Pirellulales bacterium]